jgi:predicted ribosomally synthesized peptide with SipW-like signal peptide
MTSTTTESSASPTSRGSRSRKLLLLLLVIGAIGTIAVGTLASFNAATSNGGNTFQTGTILLSNTVNAGSACFSYNAATFTNNNNNPNCNAFVNVTNVKPGDPAGSAVIQLADTGTINGNLSLLAGCSAGTPLAIHGNAVTLCDYLAITVQPCATYTSGTTCATTDAYCVYSSAGVNSAGACGAPALGAGVPNAGSWSAYSNTFTSATALTDPTAGNAPITLVGGGAAKAYQITWRFPDSGVAGQENPAQGTGANLTVTWSIA